MRNASFTLTEQQVLDGTKDITRRLNWHWAKPGMRLMACRKCMGRKPGEPLVRLREIEVVSVRREPLYAITPDDVRREGFPDMTPAQFCTMFMRHAKCDLDREVARVEFKYIRRPCPACGEPLTVEFGAAVRAHCVKGKCWLSEIGTGSTPDEAVADLERAMTEKEEA